MKKIIPIILLFFLNSCSYESYEFFAPKDEYTGILHQQEFSYKKQKPEIIPKKFYSYERNIKEPKMIFVEGGCFIRGNQNNVVKRDEGRKQEVCVDSFYMGQFEVTQDEWNSVMTMNPSTFKGALKPVESVTWHEVQIYIKALNKHTGKEYRLPTEAEWEYAARSGGKEELWAGTNDELKLIEYSWFRLNSHDKKMPRGYTHEVGTRKSNELGFYDMSGNVAEWCNDWYMERYYEISPKNNPPGRNKGEMKVYRGGNILSGKWYLRTGERSAEKPTVDSPLIGFRLVLPES